MILFDTCFNEVAKDNSSNYRDQKRQNPIINEIDSFLKASQIVHDPYICQLICICNGNCQNLLELIFLHLTVVFVAKGYFKQLV